MPGQVGKIAKMSPFVRTSPPPLCNTHCIACGRPMSKPGKAPGVCVLCRPTWQRLSEQKIYRSELLHGAMKPVMDEVA
jgi:hypothetical protein